MNYISCFAFSFRNVSPYPRINIIDRYCSYDYTGQLNVMYVFEDTATNRSILQDLECSIFNYDVATKNITYLPNVAKDYNDLKNICKCNFCHTKHSNYKLYKFMKQD